jgi:hypothetical protein
VDVTGPPKDLQTKGRIRSEKLIDLFDDLINFFFVLKVFLKKLIFKFFLVSNIKNNFFKIKKYYFNTISNK